MLSDLIALLVTIPAPAAPYDGLVDARDFTGVRAHLTLVDGFASVAFSDGAKTLAAFPIPPFTAPCVALEGAWIHVLDVERIVVTLGDDVRVYSGDPTCWHAHAWPAAKATRQAVRARGHTWDELTLKLDALDPALAGQAVVVGQALSFGKPGAEDEVGLGEHELPTDDPELPALRSQNTRTVSATRLVDARGALVGVRVVLAERGGGDSRPQGGSGTFTRSGAWELRWQDGALVAVRGHLDVVFDRSGDGSFERYRLRDDVVTRGALTGHSAHEVTERGSDFGGDTTTSDTADWSVGDLALVPSAPRDAARVELVSNGLLAESTIGGCKLGLTLAQLTIQCPGGASETPVFDTVDDRRGDAKVGVVVDGDALHVSLQASLLAPADTPVGDDVWAELLVSRRTARGVSLSSRR